MTLRELHHGCWAYVQRDGGWGWSNAGLVVGDGASLLVDTLFDLRLTASMLEAFATSTRTAPIVTAVNTHANGDHCFGNELLDDVEIIASTATATEMAEMPPAVLAALNRADGEVGDLFRHFFGEFDFDGITLRVPDRTFDGRLEVEVGGRVIELLEVGPAHTRGDTLVVVPDAGAVGQRYCSGTSARRRVVGPRSDRRTASTQPTTTHTLKMNHCTAYERCGPSSSAGNATGTRPSTAAPCSVSAST